MSNTFGEIKDKVWDLLWQKSTSTNFSDSIVWNDINTISLEVWRGRVINLLSPWQIIRAWQLWFQDWDFWTRIKSWWICTVLVEVWDTEVSTATDNLNSDWYVLIWSDIIKYTGVSSTQLTWVTWITTEHEVWDKITQLYEVPADFEKMEWIDLVTNWSWRVTYTPIPLNTWFVRYVILRDDTTVLLQIDWLDSDSEVRVRYTKLYVDLVLNADVCPFPDKYWTNVIAYLVAWWLAYDKWLPTSERLLNKAYGNLRSMYQYFTNEIKVVKQRLEPIHYNVNKAFLWRRWRSRCNDF
jgi:hypothetical protein